jgi:hypothetical protein
MCDGARGDGGEADRQDAVPSGLGEASESIPDYLYQVWADLPRRERQRSRRRYFRSKIASTNRASSTPTDARILVLEAAVAELRSIVAALASARPDSDSAPDDAGLQPAPAPTDDNPGTVPEVFRAQEPVLAIIISDPSASISETASSTPTGSPPKKKSRTQQERLRQREVISFTLASDSAASGSPDPDQSSPAQIRQRSAVIASHPPTTSPTLSANSDR